MQNLCDIKDELLKKGKTFMAENKVEELKAVNKELDDVNAKLKFLEEQEADEKGVEAKSTKDENNKFKSLAEQLNAIKNAAYAIKSGNPSSIDKRLLKNDLSGGLNTNNDADGGYAIQSDFIGDILDKAFEKSEILNRCTVRTITAKSNRANWATIDDSQDAYKDGVVTAGGVQAYWANEGETVPKTKPKYMADELKLAKAMGFCWVTEEMLQDVPFTAEVVEDSFSDATSGLLTEGVINGLGSRNGYAAQPMGIMNSNALITVKAESTKLTAQDFLNMKARMRKKNWNNAVWVMHPDLESSLPLLNDGSDLQNLVFMPAGGLSGSQFDTILGRPVVFDEFMASAGTKGDILLADFSEYLLIKKGEERKDWSIHVGFLTDEQVFRIVARVNGKPMKNTTYAVRNSSTSRSPFVTLGARGAKLTAPSVTINASTGVPSWDAVSNATKYAYQIKHANGTYAQEQETSSTSVSALTDGDTIRVKAIGNGTTYLDSAYSEEKTFTESL